MCAKVAQKHEKEEERREKSPKSFVVSHILCTFANRIKQVTIIL
jgi:hypothetical protein